MLVHGQARRERRGKNQMHILVFFGALGVIGGE
jgi:hypothetical protein